MTKKLIAIPEGNLLRIAKNKGAETLSALKEKTGVDRKTLRTIDTGKPVKETTLQTVADKLRVPLAHLLGPNTLDEVENSGNLAPYHHVTDRGYHFREIKLQQLDAAALRRLVEEIDEPDWETNWILKIDQISESLETTLLKLRNSLRGWFFHETLGGDPEEQDNLVNQISSVKTSADIDKSVEQLAEQNLKVYGATYVFWNKERLRHPMEDYPLPILRYTSYPKMALSIAPEERNNSTVRVATGWEPPQKFIESELAGINSVEVDYREVWSRDIDDQIPIDDSIPF